MSILDKKCYLTANISTSKIEGNTISFYNTDKNTSILYLKLKYVDDSNLDKYFTSTMLNDYTVKLAVVKPKTMELVEMSGIKENDMFKFELPTNFTDQVGKCICELIISTIDEKLTLDEFIYSVKESATTKFNAEIEPNPDLPILKQLIEQVRELINQVGSGGSGSGHVHSNKNILDTITEEKVSYWNGVINKVDKVAGKQLSTEDYTTAEKQKLSNIDTSLLQPKTDNTLNTTNKTIVGAINELKSSSGSGSGENVDLSAYQTKSDDALTTTNKTVVGSINELDNDKTDKTVTTNIQTQVDNLVLHAGNPESSSAEIVQARGKYENLNKRHEATEVQLEQIETVIEDLKNSRYKKIEIITSKGADAILNENVINQRATIKNWTTDTIEIKGFTNFFKAGADTLPRTMAKYNSAWTWYRGDSVIAYNYYFVACNIQLEGEGANITFSSIGENYKKVNDWHYFILSPTSSSASYAFVNEVVGTATLNFTYAIDITNGYSRNIDELISLYGNLELKPGQNFDDKIQQNESKLTSYKEDGNLLEEVQYPNNSINLVKNGKLSISNGSCILEILCEKDSVQVGMGTDWSNKKWVAFGDSLTDATLQQADRKYCHIIAEKTKIKHINHGVGGTGYRRKEEDGMCFYQRMANIPTDTNLITIMGSINDWILLNEHAGNYDGFIEGNASDDISKNSLCGYINKCLDVAIQRCPDAKIGLITPPPSKLTIRLAEIRSAIKKVAEYRNIPCLDLWKVSQMRPNDDIFAQKYYYDFGSETMCHPNNAGHEWIYPQILSFIKTMID